MNQFLSLLYLFFLNSAISLKPRGGKVKKMSNISDKFFLAKFVFNKKCFNFNEILTENRKMFEINF